MVQYIPVDSTQCSGSNPEETYLMDTILHRVAYKKPYSVPSVTAEHHDDQVDNSIEVYGFSAKERLYHETP